MTDAADEARLALEIDLWFGSGPGWGHDPAVLPEGWWLGAASAVAISPEGEIFVCQRGQAADPILVYDRAGRFLRSWGRGLVGEPHGLRRDPSGDIWLTDTELHVIYRFRPNGELVSTFGRRGQPGADEGSFNMPTDLAFGPNGVIYVSDGYGNSRVVMLDHDGNHLGGWGQAGSAQGEFDTPHSIAAAPDGRVYVCDRANNRVQVFGPDGTFQDQWSAPAGMPQAITITPAGECWLITNIDAIAGRLYHLDLATWRILGWLESPGHMLGIAPWGDLYVAALTGNTIRWSQPAS